MIGLKNRRFIIVCLFSILLCILSSNSTIGQDYVSFQIDSIKKELTKDIPIIDRLRATFMLVRLYNYRHIEVDSLLDKAISIAAEHDLPYFIGRASFMRALKGIYLQEPVDRIFSHVAILDTMAEKTKNNILVTSTNQIRMIFYFENGDFERANYYRKLYEKDLNFQNVHQVGPYYVRTAQIHQGLRNYSEALRYFERALDEPQSGRIFIYNSLAKLYLEVGRPELGLEYIAKAKLGSEARVDGYQKMESLLLQGEAYMMLGDSVKAKESWEQVEAKRRTPLYDTGITAIHHLIKLHWNNKTLVDSLLDDINKYQNADEYGLLLAFKGQREIEKKAYQSASRYCKLGLKEIEKLWNNNYRSTFGTIACDCLLEISLQKNNWKEALAYQSKKIEFQNYIQDNEKIRNLAFTISESEAKQEKARLENTHKLEQEKLNARVLTYKLIGLTISAILLAVSISFFQIRKRNKKIESQKKVIEHALTDKDLLMREIHHRVKNNLQLISSLLALQGIELQNKDAQSALQEGNRRVRSMTLIHQNLYLKENLSQVNVKEYLNKLAFELNDSLNTQSNVDVSVNVENIDLDIDQLVPIGLIINELLTNALKYAFPNGQDGTIDLSLYRDERDIVFQVKDNGQGYEEKSNHNSFGTKLIESLTSQLSGELEIINKNGVSTTVTIPG